MNLYQKPSGIWAVDLRAMGLGRVTLGTRDKAEARRRLPAAMAGEKPEPETPASRPVSTSTPAEMTVDGLFRLCLNHPDVWLNSRSQTTLRSNRKILTGIELTLADGRQVLFGDLGITEVTKAVMRLLKDQLQGRGYAQGSVKRKMDMVSRAFRHADEEDLIEARPAMPRVVVPDNHRERVISPKEEVAIFDAIAKRAIKEPTKDWVRYGMALRFLLDTGCRKGEMEKLRDNWIVERGGVPYLTIPAWATKSNRTRTIPLTEAVEASLGYLRDNAMDAPASDRPGRLLFPYKGGFVWYRWQLIVGDVAKRGYDLSDVVLHSFRHTTITRLCERGMALELVADWAGHANMNITRDIYRHVAPDTLASGRQLLKSR